MEGCHFTCDEADCALRDAQHRRMDMLPIYWLMNSNRWVFIARAQSPEPPAAADSHPLATGRASASCLLRKIIPLVQLVVHHFFRLCRSSALRTSAGEDGG